MNTIHLNSGIYLLTHYIDPLLNSHWTPVPIRITISVVERTMSTYWRNWHFDCV